ncbi:MAG: hypothetical protein FWF79_04975 [Defluviitaleaceae bacterium]|nr:hypothetical protein [Defluviitaleaceae bacterium]
MLNKNGNYVEAEVINDILSFEKLTFDEYNDKLVRYQEDLCSFGIEMRSVIEQSRGVSIRSAEVKPYDLKAMNKLPPLFFSSVIIGYIYSDGQPLSVQAFYDENVTSYFTIIFPLVRVWTTAVRVKIKEIHYYDQPLKQFDLQMGKLMEKIKIHFHK